LDVSIEEIKNVLKILKPNKIPGEDGIISEFYITHWEQIKDEFFLLVNNTFEKKELSPSQYKGVLTLLHKRGEREDIRNWRPLTLLNSDYKIILFSPCFFSSSKKYRVDLSPSSAHFILERIFAASAFCV
jgi:hypothetical protein